MRFRSAFFEKARAPRFYGFSLADVSERFSRFRFYEYRFAFDAEYARDRFDHLCAVREKFRTLEFYDAVHIDEFPAALSDFFPNAF